MTNSRKFIGSKCWGLVVRRSPDLPSIGRLGVNVWTASPLMLIDLVLSFTRHLSPMWRVVQFCIERCRHRSTRDLGA
ncbi:hypothetical protein COLO4_02726 [Corchorus olitorius]|uniref:Uncharacterized protein n=1 Tax=Corchorus olitorius TaxID=93759 RepID=A0A1R3L0I7_9ROSI|nr:hypothetical protein COLO4_02726 [Corchorus olitorius]